MRLTRRKLFTVLAAGSSLALLEETSGFSQAGVAHTTAVDTADEETYLTVESPALEEPVEESVATFEIDSTLEGAAVTRIDADAFTFDPDPAETADGRLTPPVTVDVRTDGTGVVEDVVVVELEAPAASAVVERRLTLEGDES